MDLPSMADAPFHCPPDIWLDLPPPISVNRMRRIDWSASVRQTEWKRGADAYIYMAKRRKEHPLKLRSIERFEITLTFNESLTGIDLDNGVKGIIDYLCYAEVIAGDAPKNMRRLVVEFGYAPEGCRVTVKPLPLTMGEIARNLEGV